MAIKIENKSIFEAPKGAIILQQVNCQNAMGSGFAKAIYSRYPIVKQKYHDYCEGKHPNSLLGTVLPVRTNDYMFYNLFGQLYYGRSSETSKCYTNYDAVGHMLHKIALKHEGDPSVKIAIPYNMCCGLAGGDWNIILKLIQTYLKYLDVTIYKIE